MATVSRSKDRKTARRSSASATLAHDREPSSTELSWAPTLETVVYQPWIVDSETSKSEPADSPRSLDEALAFVSIFNGQKSKRSRRRAEVRRTTIRVEVGSAAIVPAVQAKGGAR